jgi:hypothetical protein
MPRRRRWFLSELTRNLSPRHRGRGDVWLGSYLTDTASLDPPVSYRMTTTSWYSETVPCRITAKEDAIFAETRSFRRPSVPLVVISFAENAEDQ